MICNICEIKFTYAQEQDPELQCKGCGEHTCRACLEDYRGEQCGRCIRCQNEENEMALRAGVLKQ